MGVARFCVTEIFFGMEVEKVGSCVVIRMKRGENRLCPEFLEALNEALDKAER